MDPFGYVTLFCFSAFFTAVVATIYGAISDHEETAVAGAVTAWLFGNLAWIAGIVWLVRWAVLRS